MKMKIFLLILILPLLVLAQGKVTQLHQNQNLNCKTCHSCDIPTKENPCIKPCPRERLITIEQTPSDAPAILTINRLKKQSDIYAPVTFSHRLHAEMADMGGGCRMCHHYNPPGEVVGCVNCHEVNRKRTDLSKPDLKGAYHQQCMNCHRQWSGKVECESCHAQNGKTQKSTATPKVEKAGKRVHPKVNPPTQVKYDTPKTNGKLVTFNHSDHVNTFSISCESCHSNESCNKCHAKYKPASLSNRSVTDKHAVCANCHNTKASCSSCHKNSVAGSFNHKTRTGFDVAKNHSKLACSRCHVEKGKFAGLKSDCSTCHGTWTKENFKHAVTGLQLDEAHSDFECSDCHQEKNYANPTCKNCHEDKTYPKDKPGKMVKKSK
ncbi:MAG: cytochrome c3 family protein [Melioribacteraceae bacterium]